MGPSVAPGSPTRQASHLKEAPPLSYNCKPSYIGGRKYANERQMCVNHHHLLDFFLTCWSTGVQEGHARIALWICSLKRLPTADLADVLLVSKSVQLLWLALVIPTEGKAFGKYRTTPYFFWQVAWLGPQWVGDSPSYPSGHGRAEWNLGSRHKRGPFLRAKATPLLCWCSVPRQVWARLYCFFLKTSSTAVPFKSTGKLTRWWVLSNIPVHQKPMPVDHSVGILKSGFPTWNNSSNIGGLFWKWEVHTLIGVACIYAVHVQWRVTWGLNCFFHSAASARGFYSPFSLLSWGRNKDTWSTVIHTDGQIQARQRVLRSSFLSAYLNDSFPEPSLKMVIIAALCVIAKTWRQPSCPSIGKWINWYIQTMEYYSVLKRNELSSHEKHTET